MSYRQVPVQYNTQLAELPPRFLSFSPYGAWQKHHCNSRCAGRCAKRRSEEMEVSVSAIQVAGCTYRNDNAFQSNSEARKTSATGPHSRGAVRVFGSVRKTGRLINSVCHSCAWGVRLRSMEQLHSAGANTLTQRRDRQGLERGASKVPLDFFLQGRSGQ